MNEPVRGMTGSLVEILHAEAQRAPARTMLTALDRHGEPIASLTAAELDHAARSLAADLLDAAAPGDRVLLPPMPDLRFQVAFMACLYARLVAVPLPPLGGRLGRLMAICSDASPSLLVAPGDRIASLATALAGEDALGTLRLVPAEPSSTRPVPVPEFDHDDTDSPAFLQYTSGSTSAPRGVMITHRAMLANQAVVQEHFGANEQFTTVSWLPLHHDMGLCLGLLQPVAARASAVVLDPATFMISPERWLQAISGLPNVRSAAPNFAYAWCTRRIPEYLKEGLDLSGWRVAVVGAEPVRADTLREFHAAFARCGLSRRALTPSYGLAEATLFVAGGSRLTEPVVRRYDRMELSRGRAVSAGRDNGATGHVELAGCGRPGLGIRVAVVDPEDRRACPDRTVGEIWVDSPGNGIGYWGQPEASREAFAAVIADDAGSSENRWLRTGDLGFIDDGELFITGRLKDLIVIHGVNHAPQDVELHVERAHALLRGGRVAAFAADGDDRVVAVAETVRRSDPAEAVEAAVAAVRAVTAELPVMVDVVVVPRGQLPRTTSGKVQRQEAARQLTGGRLKVLAQWPHDHW